ncbi:MAG: adenylate/guanylate cyclase domain-containing protein, partial [Actinomycetota bacterium]|nr:adenylate/guanylate cyclase domain-containing protein [Actinomycetota bacterium]
MAEAAWREALRRMRRPPGSGMPGAEGRALRRFGYLVPLANFTGALDVFVFMFYVLPPSLPAVSHPAHVRMVNEVAFAIYMPLTMVVAGFLSTLVALPTLHWLEARRAPDAGELRTILHQPARQVKVSAVMWLGGALVFGVLNARYSASLGALVAATVILGGATTCAVIYLVTDRVLRPVTGRALMAGPPDRPATPGVTARLLMAWGFTTAVPILGAVVLAATVLSGASMSASRVAVTVLFLGIATLGASLLAIAVAAKSVAEPLRALRTALARVERGRLDVEVAVYDGSEVGLVQAGFNRMVHGLRETERLRDLFGRHVGEEVAREALARGVQLGGEVRHAATLFVDLVGSTALATQRSPAEVVALLNRFFSLVVDVVRAEGGLVNKFEGDGALCLFGAPVEVEDPAGAALRAARRLDARLRAELPELTAGIGVSAGSVVA